MSDSEQCSNRLQLDLILLLVNFPCELGAESLVWNTQKRKAYDLSIYHMIFDMILLLVNFSHELVHTKTKYELIEGMIVICINVWNQLDLMLCHHVNQGNNEYGRYDLVWARRVILSNVSPNYTFGQFGMYIVDNNEQLCDEHACYHFHHCGPGYPTRLCD